MSACILLPLTGETGACCNHDPEQPKARLGAEATGGAEAPAGRGAGARAEEPGGGGADPEPRQDARRAVRWQKEYGNRHQ